MRCTVLLLTLLIVGCGTDPATELASNPSSPRQASVERSIPSAAPASSATSTPAGTSSRAAGPTVIFLGDSLTAGYGLAADEAFPARVAERLAAAGHPIRLINAGLSGDTSSGALSRLDWLLRQRPDVVVVGVGGNDGLRGLPLDALERNLRSIVERSQEAGAEVLLLGMQIPPNLGPDYAGAFRDLYPRLADELSVPLVPFLLEGVGGVAELNLPDGIHPTIEGARRVADTVYPFLEGLVVEAAASPSDGARAARSGHDESGEAAHGAML